MNVAATAASEGTASPQNFAPMNAMATTIANSFAARHPLTIAMLTIGLAACAHGNVRFVNSDGRISVCASTGYGAIGATEAGGFQDNCVTSATAAGYIPVEEAGSIGLVSSADPTSLRVASVLPNSPADFAGIKAGDKIVAVNNQPVNTWLEARRLLFGRASTVVKVTYRSGELDRAVQVIRYPYVDMPNGM